MDGRAYEFVTMCGWCGVELGRRAVSVEPRGVSHGICERCYGRVFRPRIPALVRLRRRTRARPRGGRE